MWELNRWIDLVHQLKHFFFLFSFFQNSHHGPNVRLNSTFEIRPLMWPWWPFYRMKTSTKAHQLKHFFLFFSKTHTLGPTFIGRIQSLKSGHQCDHEWPLYRIKPSTKGVDEIEPRFRWKNPNSVSPWMNFSWSSLEI